MSLSWKLMSRQFHGHQFHSAASFSNSAHLSSSRSIGQRTNSHLSSLKRHNPNRSRVKLFLNSNGTMPSEDQWLRQMMKLTGSLTLGAIAKAFDNFSACSVSCETKRVHQKIKSIADQAGYA
uniref:Uncharacterized protein n=1 Tax=Globodera rostochiensis TaxID=31243 RepID=A0A914H954_GLORO